MHVGIHHQLGHPSIKARQQVDRDILDAGIQNGFTVPRARDIRFVLLDVFDLGLYALGDDDFASLRRRIQILYNLRVRIHLGCDESK
jgi:hypothetical protein